MLYIKELIFMALLLAVIFGGAADVISDYKEGAEVTHLVLEVAVILASVAMIAVLAVGIWRQNRSNQHLRQELASLENKADAAQLSPAIAAVRRICASSTSASASPMEYTRRTRP